MFTYFCLTFALLKLPFKASFTMLVMWLTKKSSLNQLEFRIICKLIVLFNKCNALCLNLNKKLTND